MNTYTEFDFPYGDSYLKVSIPSANIAYVLETRDVPGIEDEYAAVTESLRQPIASAPLTDRIKPGDRVVVLVTDNTRACPDDRLLPPILAELEQKIARANITIIIALGLHPPLARLALIKKLGKEIVENYKTGIIVNKKSYEEIANKIVLLLTDDKLRERISNNGINEIQKRFSQKNHEYLKLYKNLIKL